MITFLQINIQNILPYIVFSSFFVWYPPHWLFTNGIAKNDPFDIITHELIYGIQDAYR